MGYHEYFLPTQLLTYLHYKAKSLIPFKFFRLNKFLRELFKSRNNTSDCGGVLIAHQKWYSFETLAVVSLMQII